MFHAQQPAILFTKMSLRAEYIRTNLLFSKITRKKVFIKSGNLFGGTFAIITICSIGKFIAVFALFVASVFDL